MVRINTFRLILLGIILVLAQGCISNNKDATLSYKESFELGDLEDSKIDSLYQVVGKTDYASDYKHINQVLSHLPSAKDSLVLAKAYGLIAFEHIVSNDYEKAIEYVKKSITLFKKLGMWVEVMRNNKNLATIYRHQNKLDLMTTLLKNNIRQMDSLSINSFGILYPIHELSVHYSYDLGKHEEAIVQGELFFEKLAHFDSMPIKNQHFDYIKESEKDVIDLILGVSYLKVGQFEKSYSHLNRAFMAYSEQDDPEKLSRVHKAFMEYYILSDDKEKLILHKEEFYKTTLAQMQDFTKSQMEINRLKIKSIEDEGVLQVLKEENRLKTFLIYGSVILLLVLAIFQWYHAKLTREKREVALKLEKQYEFNEFKTNLLITVAHELRTPLTIVLGYLQLISDKKIKRVNFQTYLDKIKRSSEGILSRMSDIIHLLKEDETKERAALQSLKIQPFLKGLLNEFEGIALMKKILLVYRSQLQEAHTISTDPKILSGLLNNLIVNAIKFSPTRSKVEMYVRHDGKNLSIDITDEGIGISDLDQEKVFDKFKRISTSSRVDGFGLGLAIVKESTEQLGGQIKVNSILGKGSTFTLTLPNEIPIVTEKQNSVSPLKPLEKDPKHSLATCEKEKILIVEDNPEMCSFYDHIFSLQFHCTYAFNGMEGLDFLRKGNFDIIISDVMMPKMDGFEFKENVRSQPRLRQIPFIMVTAKDGDTNKIKAFNIGVDDYVVKPFNKNELLARVKSLIANKKEREKWSLAHQEQSTTTFKTFGVRTVRKLHAIVLKYLEEENFNVNNLALEIGLSQRQLVRVTKKLTGLTPVKFILEVRLLEAYKKIKNGEEADINSVRFAVGIQSASYFSTQFKKRFGLNPKDFLKSQETSIMSIEDL